MTKVTPPVGNTSERARGRVSSSGRQIQSTGRSTRRVMATTPAADKNA